MKKKLVLSITAAVMALALAIGGTLMLFTSQTEKATNNVTLKGLGIILEEQNEEGDWEKIDGDEFTGVEFGIEPGDNIDKWARIVAEDNSVDSYLRVWREITWYKDGEEVEYMKLDDEIEHMRVYAIVGTMLERAFAETGDWTFVSYLNKVPNPGQYDWGYFYYTNADGTLKELTAGDAINLLEGIKFDDLDSDEFKALFAPTGTPGETWYDVLFAGETDPNIVSNTLKGWGFDIELIGQAIQVKNNPYGLTGGTSALELAGAFDGMQAFEIY